MTIENIGAVDYGSTLLRFLDDIEKFEKSKHFPSGLNFFVAAGLEKQEIGHSKILAFLLDPNQPHGLKDFFLKRLLRRIIDSVDVSSENISALTLALADLSDARVVTEQDRIDILVWSKSNRLVLALENKVDAKEGKNQLERYFQKIDAATQFKDFEKLYAYLTKEGISGSDDRWAPISWRDIEGVLKETLCHKLETLTPNEKYFIEQYLELIRRHIVVNKELIEECQKLYRTHRLAIDLINKYGEVSNFGGAANRFFEKNTILQRIGGNPNTIVFLPQGIYDITPEITLIRPWWNQKRPFLLSISISGNKIEFLAEVGPMSNEDNNRDKFVTKLRSHFQRNLNKPITKNYTRIWSQTQNIDKDIVTPSEDEILAEMEKLFEEFKEHVGPTANLIKEQFSI